MSPRVLFAAAAITISACAFDPDLSRFEPCDESGQCPAGFLCLTEAQRCVPECGENCLPRTDAGADAGFDAGVDAGGDQDAGVDAGPEDAGMDAGVVDGGTDAGQRDAGPALALAPMTLAPAIETKSYAVDFVPTGGEGNSYSFSIDGGVPGFVLSTTGRFATTMAPTPGTFPFSITVRDEAVPPAVVTTSFELEVRPLLRVASNVLVEGRQGQAYLETLSATGGTPPYRWILDGGMLPGGVSLNDAGVLQGTPNSSGATVSFGVTVTDSATPPQAASRQVSVTMRVLDLAVTVANSSAPDGRVGTFYDLPLKAYAGSLPYTWSIQTGSSSLPPGIMLMNAGSNWSLSGTPTMRGTFPFTLRCSDSLVGVDDSAVSITVY